MGLELSVPNRTTARITYTKGRMTTTWDLNTTDDQETLLTALREVLAFVSVQAPAEPRPEVQQFMNDLAAQAAEQAETGNGWAKQGLRPELPQRLRGEVEMIDPD